MRAHDAQPRDVVVERVERRHRGDQGDGLVELRQHRLRVGEQRREVRIGSIQRFGDPRLVLVLQSFVRGLATNVHIDFDTVPRGVLGLKGSPCARDIARLQSGDGVDQRRPYGFDARDLEALALRNRLTGAVREGQRGYHNGADSTKFLDHPDTDAGTEASKLFRNRQQIASSITLESKTCKWDNARAVIIHAVIDGSVGAVRDKAKDLYDTAQLEEKQFNATKLYRQIVEEYPESAYANQAKTRLAELEKAR